MPTLLAHKHSDEVIRVVSKKMVQHLKEKQLHLEYLLKYANAS